MEEIKLGSKYTDGEYVYRVKGTHWNGSFDNRNYLSVDIVVDAHCYAKQGYWIGIGTVLHGYPIEGFLKFVKIEEKIPKKILMKDLI